jgi:hypothetical protein
LNIDVPFFCQDCLRKSLQTSAIWPSGMCKVIIISYHTVVILRATLLCLFLGSNGVPGYLYRTGDILTLGRKHPDILLARVCRKPLRQLIYFNFFFSWSIVNLGRIRIGGSAPHPDPALSASGIQNNDNKLYGFLVFEGYSYSDKKAMQ